MTETKQTVPLLISPEQLYGALLPEVQLARIFPDEKTFADAIPRQAPELILLAYQVARTRPNFDLTEFVCEHFDLPYYAPSDYKPQAGLRIEQHIENLWPILQRTAQHIAHGTLIPLPYPYIVPGGRFNEIFYWDSYFTMLGLKASGRVLDIEHMVENFAYLIDLLGFIPNGNRTYFLTRSQPPFFAAMVNLLAEEKEDYHLLVKYLPQLEKEYTFWMRYRCTLTEEDPEEDRVVRLRDGSILNRYWDNSDAPRAEMYATDLSHAELAERYGPHMFREIRAACESGWDFSARWFADGEHFRTINCTAITPVDLNSLLYHLEQTIATAHRLAEQPERAEYYRMQAEQRRAAIDHYCWDEELGFYRDYNYLSGNFTPILSLAAVFPLYFELASKEQARKVSQMLEKEFLQPGGLTSTLNLTGEQWDAPNGWAPLQWMAIQGLRNYGYHKLANTIKKRWIEVNIRVYQRTGKMVEKYNVLDVSGAAGGGEYPLQDGFGWSNGVLLCLLRE